jgi:hypothetical protein
MPDAPISFRGIRFCRFDGYSLRRTLPISPMKSTLGNLPARATHYFTPHSAPAWRPMAYRKLLRLAHCNHVQICAAEAADARERGSGGFSPRARGVSGASVALCAKKARPKPGAGDRSYALKCAVRIMRLCAAAVKRSALASLPPIQPAGAAAGARLDPAALENHRPRSRTPPSAEQRASV